ncbi:MAG: HPr kinase/phosphorylase [Brevundimonas sp.]
MASPFHYRLGSARLSSDIALGGLSDAEPGEEAVIAVRRGRPTDSSLEWTPHPDGAEFVPDWARVDHMRSTDGAWYRIRYDYRGHFADISIRSDGREITVDAGEGETDAELSNLIEGPILGRAMRLAGYPSLHATALSFEGRAIALMGASGVGKSSLAWALVQQGCRLVSDDMVGLALADGRPVVHPGRARLRIWPDVVEGLGVDASISTALFPTTREMTKVGVRDPGVFSREPVPLHAVYQVRPRGPKASGSLITELPASERLAELAANLHGVIAPDRQGRKRELALLAQIAAVVPVRAVTLPHDLEALSRVAAELRPSLFG